jgi:hypothetical protein
MRKSRFHEEQIVAVLKEADAGAPVFFSRPFSSSKAFRRRASFSSSPPYLVFQR